MDYVIVIHYLGILLMVYAGILLIPLVPTFIYKEFFLLESFLTSAFFVLVLGFIFFGATYYSAVREERKIYIRESLALVGLGWILVTVLGGLPFYLSQQLGIIDSVFESISGFTTTGATVVSNVESLPKGLLFWRAFTHFLGGIGVVVIFVSVLPYIGAGGRLLFESESFAPDVKFIKLRIKESVKQIVAVYLFLNALDILLLTLCGMDLFEAVCHAFATLATGGFSTRGKSIEDFHTTSIEIVTIFFMLCGGTNLLLLHRVFLRGDVKGLLKDPEWRAYISIWALSTLLATLSLMGINEIFAKGSLQNQGYETLRALRETAFTFASVITTTGFSNSDFEKWPVFAQWLLMIVAIIGSCAGSTAGGMKVIRFIILTKVVWNRVLATFQPKVVKPIRVGDIVVREDIQKEVLVFCSLWLVVIFVGSIVMSFMGLPIVTSVSASIACFCNIGPGLDLIGPSDNYLGLPGSAKIVLGSLMLAGRVEMFSIFVLLVPSFWSRK